MREMLTKNLNLKALSLLVAFILWLIILNIEDPAIVGNFEGIPVTILNDDALDSIDKVYNVTSGDLVDVEVRGKRSIIENLSRTDFVATANLNELSIVNAMEIKVSVPEYQDQVEVVDQSVSTMEIAIENLVTEQFRVDIVEKGTVRDGYYINEKTASPNIVQIRGAESVISKINEVVVDVNVTGADKTFEVTASPTVYDHNGTLMDSEKIEFSHEEFDITVSLLETKTVKLNLELKGTPAYGYEYLEFEYEPKEVDIAGTKEELAKVSEINVVYDINGAREDIEDEVNIADYLHENVFLIHENQNAVVNIDITPQRSKEITFSTSSIKRINEPEDKIVNISDVKPITVRVLALEGDLKKLNLNNINPYIDLAEFRGNSGYLPIQFDPDIEGIRIPSVNIYVTLTDKTS